MPRPTERRSGAWAGAFLLALLALLALAAWQWRAAAPVSTDLLQLLPGGSSDPLAARAEQRMQEPLNRDLILLVGHARPEQAFALAQQVGEQLEQSALFESLQWRLQPDLAALREQIAGGRLGLLAAEPRERLLQSPAAFVEARVQALFDPFAASSLLPSAQDWFGLGQLIQQQPPARARVQMNSQGALYIEHQGQTWALLRARAHSHAFDQRLPPRVAAEVAQARHQVSAAGGELLATSGLLYAAHGQQQAASESSLIGGISLACSLLLLLGLFRSLRILLALLPVLVGLLAGVSACIALFGQIHIMTLVLGTSLIGVALDFPLHLLSKSWGLQPWHSLQALRLALPGLRLALLTNLIGYLALAFTPFPALTQVAVFSASGLLAAFLCSVCLLPWLFAAPLTPWPGALRLARGWLGGHTWLRQRLGTPLLLGLLLAFCLGGLLQLDTRDDLRQWVARAPQLQEDALRTAQIVGYQPTSQFFLVRATDEQQLLEREAELCQRLQPLLAAGQLGGYQALSQFVASPQQQQQLAAALPALLEHSQALQALGIPRAELAAEVAALQALPPLSVEAALAGPLGEAWRPLWLGTTADGVASIVSLQGPLDSAALQAVSQSAPAGVELIDRPAQLNALFAQTQVRAAELKLVACVLILGLLWLPFGLRGALRCLAVPLLAALAALASLGWLGQPLTLFALFGLLLVTAIGVDYAILMREAVGGRSVSLLGTALAALTTWLSFGLLALSQTPAVSSFGLAVSLGLLFSFLLAPWAARRQEAPAC